MKKIKVILSALLLGFSLSYANAGILDFVKRNPASVVAGVGGTIYLQSAMHKARDLSYNLPKVEGYFKINPQDFNPVAQYVLWALAHPANKKDYERYKRLAEIMGLDNIPPYVAYNNNKPIILEHPQPEYEPTNNLPYPSNEQAFNNIIYTPQGEPIDTTIEFPNQPIASWEDYVYAKRQADILADAMKNAGMGQRPSGYAAHHIVAWDDNRYPVCQDLRDLLSNNNILINDAENGVYLPTRRATKNPNEAYHPEIHTKDYYENVYYRIVIHNNDVQGMKNELRKIGNELKNNQFKY